jgi:VanZ family protein
MRTSEFRRWIPALIVTVILFVAAVVPLSGSGSAGLLAVPGIDKLLHALGYAVLAAALAAALDSPRRRSTTVLAAAFAVAAGYGGLLELVQLAVPTRHASALDLLADAAGAVVGVIGVAAARRGDGDGEAGGNDRATQ